VILPGAEDTIAAIATAPGRGALAVVRLSGPNAHRIAARVLDPWHPEPRRAWRATLRHPDAAEIVERPVVTVYAAPRSYTGEDAVELSVHGGAVAPTATLAALLAAGARQALPGEFTRRAVANGKMDVLQAEAVADLVDARSRAMFSAAHAQLEGGLSRRIAVVRDAILQVEALIAYDIDFPEEDEGPVDESRVQDAVQDAASAIDALLATADTGEMLRTGATVVIAGAPNTGKSSLFNALVGDARAIVTEVPGTTRDAIEAVIDVGPWPVRLIDTAGLRETADVVERLGIEVSERWLARAELVLVCGDTADSLAEAVVRVRQLVGSREVPRLIVVRTKGDAGGPPPESKLGRGIGSSGIVSARGGSGSRDTVTAPSGPESPAGAPPAGEIAPESLLPVTVSAHTGAGLSTLAARMQHELAERHESGDLGAPLLTRERHVRAVRLARQELDQFVEARAASGVPATIAAVHLRAATHALETLIGVIDVDDVLDRVFRTFCVGK
jgi:tRNA modification GTPase